LKQTGIVRRIDDLGRIVIPKEIRDSLGVYTGDGLDISVSGDSITLKKSTDRICPHCSKIIGG
jgi:transcriptional pleiotropic regulator of transition state genes